MSNNKSVYMKWYYSPEYKTSRVLPDPRVPIARLIQWTRGSNGETVYTVPEPDNFNRAVFTRRPIECKFIKNQIIYKSEYHQGWFTVCLVSAEQMAEFEAWAGANALALWRHMKPAALKRPRLLLERTEYYKELSTNERLLTMGYYKNFAIKYFEGDTAIVKSLIGEARANLIDLVPEERDMTLVNSKQVFY